jgi:hypothetical protein
MEHRHRAGRRPATAALVRTNLGEYLTGSPFIDELVVDGWQLDAQGMLAIPMKPGLGIQINFDALEEYTGKRFDPKTLLCEQEISKAEGPRLDYGSSWPRYDACLNRWLS